MGRARARHKTQRPPAETVRPSPQGATVPMVALWMGLAVVVFLAYSNSFHAALTMDSPTLVERDTRLREATAENLELIWTKNYWWPSRPSNLFRPMTTLSFLFNYSLLGNGARPTGYHVVNFLLHALNVTLVYHVMRRVAGPPLTAFVAAALFATHPIATEAVTNVAGRADLLAAASVLGAFALHLEALRRPNPWPWRIGMTLVALLGVFAKESAAMIVAVLLLHDGLLSRRGDAPVPLSRLWPSYALLAPVFAALFLVRSAALADMGYYRDHFVDNPLLGLSWIASRLTALRVAVQQLLLLLWPQTLSSDYSFDQIPLFSRAGGTQDALTIGAALLIAALLGVAVWLRRRQPLVAFFILFYCATLLPTSNLLIRIGSIMAERFLYLPSVAFAALAALGLQALVRRRAGAAHERVLLTVTAVVVLGYSARTFVRNRDWADEATLFRVTRQTSPRSFKAHKGVANALLADNPSGPPLDEAIAAAEQGLAIIEQGAVPPADRPSDLMAALGLAYVLKGDELARGPGGQESAASAYRRAVAVLERAVETDREVNARVRQAKIESGASADEIFDVGLRRVHGTLGTARMRLGDHAGALASFAHLRRLDPGRADGYMQSAWALASAGRKDEAALQLLQAIVLDERPDALSLLRAVYRDIDPALEPIHAAGHLDLAQPRVRTDVTRACRALVDEFVQANRRTGAEDIRRLCIGRFATPADAFSRP